MQKKLFCVTDTETATLPYASRYNDRPDMKKRIAIARPLIYDLGWTLVQRDGTIVEKRKYLVAETFSVPDVFNTAYYAEKRPIYLDMLKRGEISVLPWNDIMDIYLSDLEKCTSVGAFNSMFDFKKAIPFTELYIQKLYSPDFQKWYNNQTVLCDNIAKNACPRKEREFEPDVFRFRGKTYPLFDLWGLATKYLLNTQKYKNECLAHDMLTDSGMYFKTSAESTFRFLQQQYDFNESHTALDDAIIESFILSKIARYHKIEEGIEAFPFRMLGETPDYILNNKKKNEEGARTVYNRMVNHYQQKVDELVDNDNLMGYVTSLRRKLNGLEMYLNLPLTTSLDVNRVD